MALASLDYILIKATYTGSTQDAGLVTFHYVYGIVIC